MTVRWTVRAAEDRARSSREKESLEVHQKRFCVFLFFLGDLRDSNLASYGSWFPSPFASRILSSAQARLLLLVLCGLRIVKTIINRFSLLTQEVHHCFPR